MVDARLKQGLVQVYTGEGKGKTTAALGLALRAVGRKFRVCMIQFVKGCDPCGEHLAAKMLAPYLTIVQTGHKGWLGRGKPSPEAVARAREAFQSAKKAVTGAEYDLVILDEINAAVFYNLVSVEELLQLIKEKGDCVELVLTGRNAAPEIVEAADLVTEMREIKHYYKAGVKARIGIEK
ncbi:MAG TPA: cob(I)yrinic acid a,c-diamide adenosyltransferase [Geobacteraceae bacterium]|mgnify:CR=1 FL=1|nr:cob(I)yrinic acid a,c-diamide adenosyltransferase [Geobacteraceae bacterium]